MPGFRPTPPGAPHRVVVEQVSPATLDRVSAAKGTVDHPLTIAAAVYADGHDVIAAQLRWRRGRGKWIVQKMTDAGNDRFETVITPRVIGGHEFLIDGWVDPHATWRHRVEAWIGAGMSVDDELETGALLIEGELDRLHGAVLADGEAAVVALRAGDVGPALASPLAEALSALPHRTETVTSGPWRVWVERERAAVGAWYEMFPRSYGGLQGAAKRLEAIAEMGFDVVYLPPIHPIGKTARKGPGNTLMASEDDPGSPWAIGSELGGHEALDPTLGTLDDFADFLAEAQRLGLEVSIDYALQCSPDHPWVHEHPEWFRRRPDGTIRYAENPPKKYQDVYPIELLPDKDSDRRALWRACKEVMEVWIGRGIQIFRVDNPHTKPFAFWEWLIEEIHKAHPEVVFLAEAFTRPAVMHRLAEIGFSQSYTYFTWRNTKEELTEYGEELASGPASSYFRPNMWTNTPDILSGPLRHGPASAFKLRAVLAATLSPSWGMYSGYELCENEPASETNEEYAASEKYQIKERDWDNPCSISRYIARLNDIRHRHPALGDLHSLRFHFCTSDQIVAYTKQAGADTILTVVSLDPHNIRDGSLWLDLEALGLPLDEPLDAYDELTRQVFIWHGPEPYVRLDPGSPAHVIHLRAASSVSDAERAGP